MRPNIKTPIITAMALAAALLAVPALAQTAPRLVPDFGAHNEVPDPFEKPDPSLRYKAAFDVSQAARTPGVVHQGLECVARMVNSLGHHGAKLQPGDIVVTMHGPAAKPAMMAAAFAKRFNGEANPNAELINRFQRLDRVQDGRCSAHVASNCQRFGNFGA